ncbi:acyl-CoA dehydrogenase family protein [Mycobacterium intracellulare]|uniref:Acyl-CoA dehydrogenase family protein n=1 Tax=Mycobacterium intracellulare subsp. chimaera TaxID=222805 RepID=A0A1Y0T591_MYCIT|nr:acyl-CoA dehydrogenase family protein [Mycobacterium intracellulare]AOS91026.1 acyl-CoA dehydrogenase [Mycobacterium intracellulare subsp. chimaera]ARV80999.1 acyl-CoA dehydrogenase [Mycobacterium intracellulare subsp. chimaera]ASL08001.1 putative acyl-CoA dehydrogenase [Mycobacterium intracellulare subsp. chimaera]ASL13655.1 putative acyl-CoA dehydrogenase [Mycobacterium intracellulare subsp. chimaera]ASL19788.1 putative acyl-CoA dehydrogenase [Mycobacterium intracellulare subsp. chimaera]
MAQQAQVTEEQARALAEESRETGWDKPSFAKELFLGRFPLELIHPFPTPTEADETRTRAFLDSVREFLETVDGSVIERDAQIPDEYVKGLADLGCFGMKIPTEYGGLGMSQVAYNRALMMVTSVHPSLGALLSAHQSIGVPEPLKLAGTPEQKKKFLPRCAAGAISAFLLTEPDVGSDPARLASTATPIDGGQAYELDGVKLWTTNGVVAELLVIMARVPKSEGRRGGISAFVVEADSPGITVERRNKFMGLRGIENGVTRLHRVRVPRENLIGSEGDGLKIALTTLNAGRLSIPASATGSSKWALKIAREWSGERVQWGKPLAEHEAVARKLSFIAATVYALDAVLELSAQMADEGRNDIRIEAALAKLWSSEMACVIADEVMQIRGGRGYETAESLAARGERAVPVEQALRDLRINRIFEGSSEIMQLLIAREAVDAHLAAAGDLAKPDTGLRQKAAAAVGASGFYAKWLPQLVFGEGQRPRAYHEFGPLAAHLRFIERSSRKLARNTFYGMARWQAKLEQRQGFLGRVVDIGAELFAMSAACVHAESQRAADPVVGQQAYELAEAFCAQATLRVEALFRGLWDNTDASDVQLTRNLLQGRYGWLEAGIIDQSEGTGPWIAHWEEGESTEANLARRFSSGDRSATSPR